MERLEPELCLGHEFIEAVHDRQPVTGWTHNFYRYPARFSPRFAAAAIRSFSRPGDLVLDPYMGGGTTVVEGIVLGRHVVGNDLNALAAFIVKVKTTGICTSEVCAITRWANRQVPRLSYRLPSERISPYIDPQRTHNLGLVRARFIKKVVAAALASIEKLPSIASQDFARCVVLRTAQWALDGRQKHTSLEEFRNKLSILTHEMLESLSALARQQKMAGGELTLLNRDAAELDSVPIFCDRSLRASLVVTSPPYCGRSSEGSLKPLPLRCNPPLSARARSSLAISSEL
jgi:hypothetical protein